MAVSGYTLSGTSLFFTSLVFQPSGGGWEYEISGATRHYYWRGHLRNASNSSITRWPDERRFPVSQSGVYPAPFTAVVGYHTVYYGGAGYTISNATGYVVSITAGPGGTVSSAGGIYLNGRSLSFSATATSATAGNNNSSQSFKFVSWSDNNTNASRTITVSQDITYTASFAPRTFKLSIQSSDVTKGTVQVVTTDGVTWVSGRYFFPSNTPTNGKKWTAIATPVAGYKFVGWYRGGVKVYDTLTAELEVMSQDTAYEARFEASYFQLTVTAGEGGSIECTPEPGQIEEFASVSIKAIPDWEHDFDYWTNISGAPAEHTFLMPSADFSTQAVFKPKTPTSVTLSGVNVPQFGLLEIKRGDNLSGLEPVGYIEPIAGACSAPLSVTDGGNIPVTNAAPISLSGIPIIERQLHVCTYDTLTDTQGFWEFAEVISTASYGDVVMQYRPPADGIYGFKVQVIDATTYNPSGDGGVVSRAPDGTADCYVHYKVPPSGAAYNVAASANGATVEAGGSDPERLIDGVSTTKNKYWQSAGTTNQNFTIKTASLVQITSFKVTASYNDYQPNPYEVYISPDITGDTWTKVGEYGMALNVHTQTVGVPQAFRSLPVRRIQVRISKAVTSGKRVRINEFEVTGQNYVTPASDFICTLSSTGNNVIADKTTAPLRVQFSEQVTDFSSGDLLILRDNTVTVPTISDWTDEGGGLYTFNLTGITGEGALTLQVPANVCKNAQGEDNPKSNIAEFIVTQTTEEWMYSIGLRVGITYTLLAYVVQAPFNYFKGWYDGENNKISSGKELQITPQNDAPLEIVGVFEETPLFQIETVVSAFISAPQHQQEGGESPFLPMGDIETNVILITEPPPDKDVGTPNPKWFANTYIVAKISAAGENSTPGTPAEGWIVAGWSLYNVDTNKSITTISDTVGRFEFTLNSNVRLTCYLERRPITGSAYVETVAALAQAGTVKVAADNKEGTVIEAHSGDDLTFTATPESGFTFVGWYDAEDELVSNANPYIALDVETDLTLYGKFATTISLTASDDNSGGLVKLYDGSPSASISPTSIILGDSVAIEAIETDNSNFIGWFAASDVTFENPLSDFGKVVVFDFTGTLDIVARFVPDESISAKYLVVRHYNNNEGEYQSGLGRVDILGTEDVEQISQEDWKAFYYESGGTPPSFGSDARFYKTKDNVKTLVQAELSLTPTKDLGVMRWDRSYLVEKEGQINPGEPKFTIVAGTSLGAVSLVTHTFNNHNILTIVWGAPIPASIGVEYADGFNSQYGGFNITPPADNKTITSGGFSELHIQGEQIAIEAYVMGGYIFDGWYRDILATRLVTTSSRHEFKVETPVTFYAKFRQDTDAVFLWEGGGVNKTLKWRSKRYVSNQPINLSSGRIYGDGYPIRLMLYAASSPDVPITVPDTDLQVTSQQPRRLPTTRPEKYVEVEVQSKTDVTNVTLSTSMRGLL